MNAGRHARARKRQRQRNEMGTLGSGNHYLELQEVTDIYDPDTATTFGLAKGAVVISIHCGSRGLGHQIGTEFLKSMAISAHRYGISLPDRELACAPIDSDIGQAIYCFFDDDQSGYAVQESSRLQAITVTGK